MELISGDTLIYLILVGMWAVLVGYISLKWYRNLGKYLVRIKYSTEEKALLKPEGNKVTIAKGKGRYAPAWTVEFDLGCLYFSKGLFTKRLTLDVMPDAKKAISYHRDINETDIPLWTRKEHDEYATLSGLRALQALGEQKTSIILWIIIALQLVGIILPFLMTRGLRF